MSATQTRQIFVNLPVKDLTKTVDFFTKLGFEFDPKFTDENATCLIINDNAFAMLLVEDFFKKFIKKDVCNTTTHAEAICALSAESRDQVDEIVDKALAAGGRPANDPMDEGFMYARIFEDLDGHLWEILYMDPNAMEQ